MFQDNIRNYPIFPIYIGLVQLLFGCSLDSNAVNIVNKSEYKIDSVELVFAGESVTVGSLSPGEAKEFQLVLVRDGAITIVYGQGESAVTSGEMGYVTKNLKQSHDITILMGGTIQYESE